MQIVEKIQEIQPNEIPKLLKKHYSSVMSLFYETQSRFLSEFYKRYRLLNQTWKISKTAFNPTVHVNKS